MRGAVQLDGEAPAVRARAEEVDGEAVAVGEGVGLDLRQQRTEDRLELLLEIGPLDQLGRPALRPAAFDLRSEVNNFK